MPWIKKNPHLVVLLIVALLVITGAALVAKNTQSFNEKFAPVQEKVVPGEKIVPLDVSVLDEAQKELEKPTVWKSDFTSQALFVPFRYSINKGTNQPEKAGIGEHWEDPLTHKKIPDAWFMKFRLPVTDPAVPTQDPDGDGFSNADEWRNNTDPNSKESHPQYYTLLFLKQFERVPFLLKFTAYDGDPKKDKPEDMQFQINTVSVRSPSKFVHIGEDVANGKYKVIKFQFKTAFNKSTESDEDVSELTIENNETKSTVVLIKDKLVDSPDSFGIFQYEWPTGKAPMRFRVPKLGKFVLLPNKDPQKDLYQLLDINDQEASIKTPSGETVTIKPHP